MKAPYRRSKSGYVVIAFTVVWSALTIMALTWGNRLDWPDNVHIRYGLPFVWGNHTLVTIQGPADIWRIDITALLLDLIIWLGAMNLVLAIIMWRRAIQDTQGELRRANRDC